MLCNVRSPCGSDHAPEVISRIKLLSPSKLLISGELDIRMLGAIADSHGGRGRATLRVE
jgi:hypothetical protein